jgi:serine protease Do/serine protease DegQ
MRRALCLTLLAFLLFPLAACERRQEARIQTTVRTDQVKPPVEKPAPEILSTQEAFIEVSRQVTPAVVNISAARTTSVRELAPFFDEFFGDLFRDRPELRRKEQSLGSGFILSPNGFILTNEHVVRGAEEIKVKLSDQSVYDARVIGADPRTDVAVIKIEPKEKLPAVVLGDSDKLRVGEWALAIGNPFGLDRTLTVGVISAVGRADVGIEDYEDFIQTDASINPGNSGGPLLNIYGEVMGINTAIVAAGQGIGFAIPVNLARQIADQLIETGKVSRGWLGVSIQPLTPELAESFGLERAAGALVNQVVPGSPADQAGLRRGDVLLTIDGRAIRGVRELQLQVASVPPGRSVSLGVLRDGKPLTLKVTITAQEAREVAAAPPASQGEGLGITVAPAEGSKGVLVAEVDPDSAAAEAGVQPGDVILAVNQVEVNDPAAFNRAAVKAKTKKNAVLLIRRGETILYLAFPTR